MTSDAARDATARDAAVLAARRLQPTFTPGQLLHVTGKSVLVAGTCDGQPVVAKLLLDVAPFWRDKFAREIRIYQAFAKTPPPVRAPHLVAADPEAGVLIVERLTGEPLEADRYPRRPLRPAALTAVLDAVDALARWLPAAPINADGWNYAGRIDRYRSNGLLDDADHQVLTELLAHAGPGRCFAHGDALPGNIWLTDDPASPVAFLDWEFAGFFLPGLDLALLWVLLRDAGPARDLIAARIPADPAWRAAFTLNQAMVFTRELRTHREAESSAWREARLAALEADWDGFRSTVLHPGKAP
ncbi:phosphotransferase [Nonomuraea sp. NPDC003754]